MPTDAKTRFEPSRIAAETFLIHDHHGEGETPVSVALNSMVIRAAEPVVVDTGMAENRDQFLADVFSLVEPAEIRWVFISHDDVDHTGNVNALMDARPQRHAGRQLVHGRAHGSLPGCRPDPPTLARRRRAPRRRRPRTLLAVQPPVFDSPTTRGLYDPRTGVYWASDGFATPMLRPVRNVAELDEDFWLGGINTFDRYVSPWLTLVDDARFQATVDRVAALAPTVVAGCHTPVITADRVAAAISATRRSPSANIAPQPDQAVLEQIQAALTELVAA